MNVTHVKVTIKKYTYDPGWIMILEFINFWYSLSKIYIVALLMIYFKNVDINITFYYNMHLKIIANFCVIYSLTTIVRA